MYPNDSIDHPHPLASAVSMKVQPPSEKLRATNEALSRKPLLPLSAEKAREQVREHLEESQWQILRMGRDERRDLRGL